jgi:hypothetical protein
MEIHLSLYEDKAPGKKTIKEAARILIFISLFLGSIQFIQIMLPFTISFSAIVPIPFSSSLLVEF